MDLQRGGCSSTSPSSGKLELDEYFEPVFNKGVIFMREITKPLFKISIFLCYNDCLNI